MAPAPSRLGYAVFAAMLAAAGLPIYIHAPKVYVDSYGVGLTALAGVLFALRLFDVVQDPVLGWLAQRLRGHRALAVIGGVAVLAGSMLGLFAMAPPIAPIWWFALMMTGLFSAFSFLTICMYAQGVAAAPMLGPQGYLNLAAWRETGALLGVCVAAVAPTALDATGDPYGNFALGFAGLCGIALWLMRGQWSGSRVATEENGFRTVLSDPIARRLLIVALMNAAPVAVSSTLFLFYVESVLAAPGWEGPLLLLFFLAAAVSAPVWTRLAAQFGARAMLISAMVLAIASFSLVLTLGQGDTMGFALICLASGAALGADFALLPALFARRMEQIAPEAAAGFGLWAFVSKLTLAFAAVVLLPALEAAGFRSGADNPQGALDLLTYLYALVPCVLKLGAIAVLATTPLPEGGRQTKI
ncbi:MFS transporter [Roseicyclus mahoneyensis]|uniref:Na+/melibiose symporter-like transporter n=1 Tax=Roseicyclus mahoneyensis TaxID=164332 RepID=A0A316GFI0_9RHOB|nr:MFS transporter [Roseicyclus mahoneyensis]PWK59747.1 Na+/melibiose symporter-like transporter [Roseicyclus mahoneyensis]